MRVVLGACSILFSLHRDMLNCDLTASPLPKPRSPTEQELQTLLDDRLYRKLTLWRLWMPYVPMM